ncbi:hypothetical protein [Arthrobacter polaris]|uniref:hypothetical protein n=1 Tax=Arthrobacter polaris TaxID=2813727 RepID=UPI001F398AFF|nr:hypothetical protein [Arthrobacter polaris]UIK89392.1 hypothetical protein J0916_02720 [Arthrobacter polaris]
MGPFQETEANAHFQALMDGTAPELPPAKDTTVIKVSEREFMRLRKGFSGATILDRVTQRTVL